MTQYIGWFVCSLVGCSLVDCLVSLEKRPLEGCLSVGLYGRKMKLPCQCKHLLHLLIDRL